MLTLFSAITNTACRSNGTVNRRLLNFFDIKSPPSPSKPKRSVLSSDNIVDPTRNLRFRLYTPTNTNNSQTVLLPVLIFFHGGGFAFLSAATTQYDAFCCRFARNLPAIVVSVDYCRTPEHRFPSQYDDGFDVVQFLDNNHSAALPPNADLSKCFLAGDSAGANLAHHVAIRACRVQFRVAKVVGLITIQPFFGGQDRTESEIRLARSFLASLTRTDWLWKVFLPSGCDRDHYAVNVSGPNAEDISGLDFPDTVVFVGGFDPLQDWQRRYYDWLKRSGKEVSLMEYPNTVHAFYAFPELPESSQLFSQVKEFVANRLSKQFD